MAANFKIRLFRDNGNHSLKLSGDFDGTSAYELLHFINNYFHDTSPILIDTNHLTKIHSFGLEVFDNNLGFTEKLSDKLMFTGKHASQFNLDVNRN